MRTAFFTLPGTFCAPTFPAEITRPNLVFILADDLGWSDPTLYGTMKV
jgi:hypothetical protein